MIIDDTLCESDFADCFAGEPSGPVEPLHDLQRGRRLRRRRRALTLALPTAAAAAGLATLFAHQPLVATPAAPPTAPAAADPTPSTARDFLLPPDAAERIHYGSTSSDPAPSTSVTRISSQQALALSKTSWRGYTPSIALRLLSSRSPVRDSDGISQDPHLYWVIVWKTPAGPHGMPVAKDAQEQAAWEAGERRWEVTAQCRQIVVVDALTGQGPDSTETDCVG